MRIVCIVGLRDDSASVLVRDADHPGVVARLEFVRDRAGWVEAPTGWSFQRRQDADIAALAVTNLRNLPLSSWGRAAFSALTQGRVADRSAFVVLHESAVEYVDRVRPGLREATTAGAVRIYGALLRMAKASLAYERARRNGVRDPTPTTARALGVSTPTARSLIHRARQAGLLAPATTGRVGTR